MKKQLHNARGATVHSIPSFRSVFKTRRYIVPYAETLVGQRLSTITGVAQVDIYGSQKYAVRVKVDPRELATRGIGIDEIESAVRGANTNQSTGTLDAGSKTRTIQATGQLASAKDFRRIIVSYRNGAPIRVEQLATVVDGVEDEQNLGWFNNECGVILAVQRQPASAAATTPRTAAASR